MDAQTKAELAHLEQSLRGWALGDVKKTAAAGAPVGAFILAAHLIDTLARLAATRAKGRPAWEEFIPKYMTRYSGAVYLLYQGFRNMSSHHYSADGIRFVDKEENRHRHWTVESSERVLHLESFIEDLDVAWEMFWRDVMEKDDLRDRVLARARQRPLLGVHGAPVESSAELMPGVTARLAGIGATHFSAEAASAASWPTLTPPPPTVPSSPPKMSVPRSRKRKAQ
jgi:hypothetical protein